MSFEAESGAGMNTDCSKSSPMPEKMDKSNDFGNQTKVRWMKMNACNHGRVKKGVQIAGDELSSAVIAEKEADHYRKQEQEKNGGKSAYFRAGNIRNA